MLDGYVTQRRIDRVKDTTIHKELTTLRAALKRLLYVDAPTPARVTAAETRADIDAVISSLNEAGLHASQI